MRGISVVVPTLNEAAIIAESLGALQTLRGAELEIILIDGGSDDATMARAQPLADVTVCAPRGRALQMNRGGACARFDTLLFLHADTSVDAAAIRALSTAIDGKVHYWGRFDVTITGSSPLLKLVSRLMNLRSRLTGIATGDQGIFVDRLSFVKLGGFPAIALMEDVAFSRLLKKQIGRPLCLRETIATSGRRWQRFGVVRTMVRMWRIRLAYAFGADPARLAKAYERLP